MKRKNTYPYDLAAMILFYLREDIREEDREQLEAWLQESDSHNVLFARIRDEKWQYDDVCTLLSHDVNGAWEVMKQKVKARARRRLVYVSRVAVSIVVLFAVGFAACAVWFDDQVDSISLQVAEILPGRSTAISTTASGATFQLDMVDHVELSSASAKNDGREVVFEDRVSGDSMTETKYNTIMTPRGGEFFRVLININCLNSRRNFGSNL